MSNDAFPLSLTDGTTKSEMTLTSPSTGFHALRIVAPTQTPANKDNKVCLVFKAKIMATSGGMSERMPYSMW